jgi:hypothetical protein
MSLPGGAGALYGSRAVKVAIDPYTVFYRSPSLTHADATDVFSDPLGCGCIPAPYGKTICWIYGVGSIDQSISAWNVGHFTGLGPPDPLGQYQYGHDNGRYGSSACQLDGTLGGALLDKSDGPESAALHGWDLEYAWSPGQLLYRPWASEHESSGLPHRPYFRLETNWYLRVGSLGTSIQYSQICAQFWDADSGRSLTGVPRPGTAVPRTRPASSSSSTASRPATTSSAPSSAPGPDSLRSIVIRKRTGRRTRTPFSPIGTPRTSRGASFAR